MLFSIQLHLNSFKSFIWLVLRIPGWIAWPARCNWISNLRWTIFSCTLIWLHMYAKCSRELLLSDLIYVAMCSTNDLHWLSPKICLCQNSYGTKIRYFRSFLIIMIEEMPEAIGHILLLRNLKEISSRNGCILGMNMNRVDVRSARRRSIYKLNQFLNDANGSFASHPLAFLWREYDTRKFTKYWINKEFSKHLVCMCLAHTFSPGSTWTRIVLIDEFGSLFEIIHVDTVMTM